MDERGQKMKNTKQLNYFYSSNEDGDEFVECVECEAFSWGDDEEEIEHKEGCSNGKR